MLPYTAAMYSNQLQAAAMSYQQRPPSPSASLQLAASLNFERLRYGFSSMQSPPGVVVPTANGGLVAPNQVQGGSPVAAGYPPTMFQHAAAAAAAAAFDPMTFAAAGFRHAFDPRTGRFLPPEEPKPQHSYIGLIAMAILSNSEKKMVLSDIYQWILDHYPYFRSRGPGWRNSIRHNLSLNDCFIKAGRSANGKGHYWAIHPANVEDFKKGDFRRRRAQRKVRKHMGLSVPDDEDDSDDSPCSSPPVAGGNFFLPSSNGAMAPPTPVLASLPIHGAAQNLAAKATRNFFSDASSDENAKSEKDERPPSSKKRVFDMDSLLSSKTDEKRAALDCSAAKRSKEENANVNRKSPDPVASDNRPQQTVPTPFFFPPPFPTGQSPESGPILAAMAAAAAAGFMPFALLPNSGMPPSLPWNFGCAPPASNAATPFSAFLPSQPPGHPYFWQYAVPNAPCSPPRSSSKTASSSNTPGSAVGNGDVGGTAQENHVQDVGQCPDRFVGGSEPASITRSPSPQDTAAQWQETFAKIMARSYQGRGFLKSSKGPCLSPNDKDDELDDKNIQLAKAQSPN